uniref:Uncharacterized protein n=1 Tax=bacterium enrichment culture clone fosmid MGS-K1 TaxID=1549356 RepID=A0A0B5KC22_9BACT|nr:hypothetical protein [bacterium enrichment culture clone fosmid MGS-K1]
MTKDKKHDIDLMDATFEELAEALSSGSDVTMSTRSVVLIVRGYLSGWKLEEGVTWKRVNGVYVFPPDGIADLMWGKYPEWTQALLDKYQKSKGGSQ